MVHVADYILKTCKVNLSHFLDSKRLRYIRAHQGVSPILNAKFTNRERPQTACDLIASRLFMGTVFQQAVLTCWLLQSRFIMESEDEEAHLVKDKRSSVFI